jgi:diguanylate cyclase (GGDEF)-like protein/PAS domain S-box-containing protein
MAMAPRMDSDSLAKTLERIIQRNPDVVSVAVRSGSGDLEIACGPHLAHWQSTGSSSASENEFIVPIEADGNLWGQIEFRFTPLPGFNILGLHLRPDLALVGFVGMSLFVVFSLYLRKVLKQLSPGKVVPNRVREALDALSEGLLVMDRKHTIVLANKSFAQGTNSRTEDLIGQTPDRFGFQLQIDCDARDFPWLVTERESRPVRGTLLTLGEGEDQRTFSVSTVPIRDEKNNDRGVVASFEDVTPLQNKQQELRSALKSLKKSSEEIQVQNQELEWLATRDTLTGCLNRRSFFKSYEAEWNRSRQQNLPLAAVMVDIDHFKSINDNYGHSTGDDVLREVSAIVMKTVDETDLVCRYGGEEFTVLMTETSIDEAELKAERCRLAIKSLRFGDLQVTASLGVSALCQQPESVQAMLDQADKCLYVAKRNGRNQVVRWDKAQTQVAQLSETEAPTREEEASANAASAIPFHAVAALTTALAHRDQSAAVHSRRVADMCVATAEGLLSMKECYVLEIAALLHDIGKIGIPDSILRKPGLLTDEELEIVKRYNRMGVDMVQGSFGQPVLTEIVEQHVVWYDMSNAQRGAGPGKRPSLSARILAIANAYDTMISDVAYRQQMSRSQAFAELRKCAGSQFDPELVERFIAAVKLRSHTNREDITVTRESALSIGLLLERLVLALDTQDTSELQQLTERLVTIATSHNLKKICDICNLLLHALSDKQDLIEVMQLAGELLDVCRATQSRLLASEVRPTAQPAQVGLSALSTAR